MRRSLIAVVSVVVAGVAAAVLGAPLWRAGHVATAATARLLCGSAFMSGTDPARAYAEEQRPEIGMGLVDWAFAWRVDRERRETVATIAGAFESRAVHRDGEGCWVVRGAAPPAPARLPPVAPGAFAALPPTSAADPRVRAAIDAAFADPGWHTKAVVVLHRGRLVGERYADGIGPLTPLHGHSLSKSVANLLVGRFVQTGRMDADAPGLVPERASMTAWHLLRGTSGLAAEGGHPFSASTRMWYLERDMAAFAAGAEPEAAPDTRWAYSERGHMLLGRALQRAAGGSAEAFRRVLRDEFAAPLGLSTLALDFDAAGTPLTGSQFHAGARDWARIGQFLLDDGVVDGERRLPPGWLARSVQPGPGEGYGAGFWLNVTGPDGRARSRHGLPGTPAGAYFARGYLGQFIVVVPERQLVVVRLGVTHRAGDADPAGVATLVARLVEALAP